MEVHSTLGPGLLESVYEEALAHEFSLRGIEYVRQKEISLRHKGKDIGKHRIEGTQEAVVPEQDAGNDKSAP